jgi:phosphoribosylanthranilate isomerase
MAQPLLIKICGLRRPEDASAAVEAGAQLGGLVFAKQSPRHVSLREARQVRDVLFGRAEVVGLFAGNALEEIAATHQAVGLDRVQLHGPEDDAFAERVEAEIGLPVLRAVAVSEAKEAEAADRRYASALLFDAKPPEGSQQAGGHGQAFDWDALDAYRGERKFLLAGGLTPANVGEAVSRMRRHSGFAGVDVSSGVDAKRGVKDAGLIAAFADAARAAWS